MQAAPSCHQMSWRVFQVDAPGSQKCSLIFVRKSNLIDYHDEMKGHHFEERFEHQLLTNLPAGPVFVTDNEPYHTVKTKEFCTTVFLIPTQLILAWIKGRVTKENKTF